jgi:hypothetical protein
MQSIAISTAAQVEQDLRARSFVPGCPPQVVPGVLLADKLSYRR